MVFALCLTLPALAWGATDEERAAARNLAKEGAASFQKGDYEEAVDFFSRAQSLVHSPVHLLFMARAHKSLGQLVKAREAYIKITREDLDSRAPKVFRDAQRDAKSELSELEPRLASLTVKITGVAPGEVTLTIDGDPVPPVLIGVKMPLDPGSHEVQASVEGSEPQTTRIHLAEGQNDRIAFELFRPEGATPGEEPDESEAGETEPALGEDVDNAGSALPYVGWASIGVGAVSLGISGYFLVDAFDLQSEANSGAGVCESLGCSDEEESEVLQTDANAAIQRTNAAVFGSIAGAFVVTGVVLLVVDGSSDSAAAPRFYPILGVNGGGLGGTF